MKTLIVLIIFTLVTFFTNFTICAKKNFRSFREEKKLVINTSCSFDYAPACVFASMYDGFVKINGRKELIDDYKEKFLAHFKNDQGKYNYRFLLSFFSQKACRRGLTAVTQLILHEAGDHILYFEVEQALAIAMLANQPTIIQLLVNNQHTNKYFDEFMPNHFCKLAMKKNLEAIFKIFVTSPATRKVLDKSTLSLALEHAAQKGHEDIVAILIPFNETFYLPFRLAVENDHSPIVQLFINTRRSNNRLHHNDLSQSLKFAKKPEIYRIISNEMRHRWVCCCCHRCTIL